MPELPPSEFIEARDGGYFITGSRVSVASIAYGLLAGQTIDEIHTDFPGIQSRSNLEGVVAFVKAHPFQIRVYLDEQERLWEEDLEQGNPPQFVERMRRRREELRSA